MKRISQLLHKPKKSEDLSYLDGSLNAQKGNHMKVDDVTLTGLGYHYGTVREIQPFNPKTFPAFPGNFEQYEDQSVLNSRGYDEIAANQAEKDWRASMKRKFGEPGLSGKYYLSKRKNSKAKRKNSKAKRKNSKAKRKNSKAKRKSSGRVVVINLRS